MDPEFKGRFLLHWHEYFGAAELPITFQYTDNGIQAEPALSSSREWCMVHMLQRVRDGHSLRFFARSFGCGGGKFSTGYASKLREHIGQFLSCGIEGEVRGERYKHTSDLAEKAMSLTPWYEAPAAHMVFKRWDTLDAHDEPEVVIFFATPDILSGLCTLAGFDEPVIENVVMAPLGSGCASLIQYPYAEKRSGRHRAVIGMFDITARPHVDPAYLTFAVTMERFRQMVNSMDESFLITPAWAHIRKRIQKASPKSRRHAVSEVGL
jgi:hypothetical protein